MEGAGPKVGKGWADCTGIGSSVAPAWTAWNEYPEPCTGGPAEGRAAALDGLEPEALGGTAPP